MSAIYHIGGTTFVNLRCVTAAIGPFETSEEFQYRVFTTDTMGCYYSAPHLQFVDGAAAFQKFIDAWKAATE